MNLSIGLVIALTVPGTAFFSPTDPMNPESAESHFDPEEIMEWGSTPFSGIPLIGDIFAGFQFLTRNLAFLFDGFPMLLTWIADSYITDAGAYAAFTVITWVLRAIYALLISIFLIEFISGRVFSD